MSSPIQPFQQFAGEDPASAIARWEQYEAKIQEFFEASSGFESEKLLMQLQEAKKGRANEMALQRLRNDAARYGYDVQRQTAIDQLEQRKQEFEQTHALDMAKFGLDTQRVGLDYAKTMTDYLSTPDRFFQGAQYLNYAGRALGRTTPFATGASPYGQGMTPQPKTAEDFAVLAGYTQPTAAGVGQQAPGTGSGAGMTGGGQSIYGAAAQGGTAGGVDARTKALKAMVDAVPPSQGTGLDDNDYAVLQAAKALYSTNLGPQAYTSLMTNPSLRATNKSAGQVLGYDVNAWEAQQKRNQIGQGSVRGY